MSEKRREEGKEGGSKERRKGEREEERGEGQKEKCINIIPATEERQSHMQVKMCLYLTQNQPPM